MKYGLDVPPFGPFADVRILAALAQDAEAAGWDGFFIWDHVAREWTVDVADPWIALAAIAMQTYTLRIGTLVTPLPRRRPWNVARETVTLDRLSGGRVTLGVGLGSGRPSEWGGLGEETDPKVRGAMLDEALDVLAGLWSGELFTYHGQHFQVEGARFLPAPRQSPRIPVWVGGYWPNKAPFRRAARWDGVFPLAGSESRIEPDDLREIVAFIRSQRESDAPFDVVQRGVTPYDDPVGAAAIVAPYAEAGATWWLEAIHPPRVGGEWEGDWRVEALLERILQGPPRA